MKQFDLKAYMDVTPEIEEAVRTGKPVVALESTILSHGMPYPENLSFAREVEKIIREQGAIPATMAIIDGRLKCGLTEDELVRMCEAKGVLKVSRRDLPGHGLQIPCGPLGAVLHIQRLLKGVSRVLCGFGENLRRLGHPLHLRGISVVHLVDNGIAWNTITCFLDI